MFLSSGLQRLGALRHETLQRYTASRLNTLSLRRRVGRLRPPGIVFTINAGTVKRRIAGRTNEVPRPRKRARCASAVAARMGQNG